MSGPIQHQTASLADRVRSLERSIGTNDATIQTAQKETKRLLRQRDLMKVQDRFLKVSLSARQIVDQTIVWRPGAVLIAITIFGGVAFAASRSPTFGIIVGFITSVAMSALVLFPSDSMVSTTIRECEWKLQELKAILDESQMNLHCIETATQQMQGQLETSRVQLKRAQEVSSADYRRKQLFAENWKAMRSVEFEKYLERVFLELGYLVETTKVTGDQGVDLIVTFRGNRIAIQVKGYESSVSNGAVQEVNAGKTFHRCNASAVITNSRFTKSATELAESVRCVLISEDEMHAFVLGRFDLWSMCFEGAN